MALALLAALARVARRVNLVSDFRLGSPRPAWWSSRSGQRPLSRYHRRMIHERRLNTVARPVSLPRRWRGLARRPDSRVSADRRHVAAAARGRRPGLALSWRPTSAASARRPPAPWPRHHGRLRGRCRGGHGHARDRDGGRRRPLDGRLRHVRPAPSRLRAPERHRSRRHQGGGGHARGAGEARWRCRRWSAHRVRGRRRRPDAADAAQRRVAGGRGAPGPRARG